MDIKDMRLFLAIAEEKNLTRAAKKNGYTQSAASHILKNLEIELGFSLFFRSQKGLILTKNGEALYPHVRRVIFTADCFEQEVAAISGIQKGNIVIGVYLSASVQWLPSVLKQFYSDYPHMTVEIREGTFQEIETWLQSGSIDFGICSPPEGETTNWIPLKKEPYMAVCSQDSPYAQDACFDLINLEKIPYIEEKGDEDLFRQFREMGIRPLPNFSSLNTYSMVAMVKQNLGVCILPELVIRNNPQNVAVLPLNPPIERILGIRLPSFKKVPPAAQMLISQLQNTVYEMEGPVL